MTCRWLFLASRTTPERFCGKPGHPYCEEHQADMDNIHSLDEDRKEVKATHIWAVCDEPTEEEQQLCAACNIRPAHAACIYCEDCCGDDPLGVLEPQAKATSLDRV